MKSLLYNISVKPILEFVVKNKIKKTFIVPDLKDIDIFEVQMIPLINLCWDELKNKNVDYPNRLMNNLSSSSFVFFLKALNDIYGLDVNINNISKNNIDELKKIISNIDKDIIDKVQNEFNKINKK